MSPLTHLFMEETIKYKGKENGKGKKEEISWPSLSISGCASHL